MLSWPTAVQNGKLTTAAYAKDRFHQSADSSSQPVVTEPLPRPPDRQGCCCWAELGGRLSVVVHQGSPLLQTERAHCAGSAAGSLSGVIPQGQRPDQELPSCSRSTSSCLSSAGEDTVPMVALECELPLSGRLSPTADAPMSSPYVPAVSSSVGQGELETLPTEEDLPPNAGLTRSSCKRKLPSRDDDVCEEGECFAAEEDVHPGVDGEDTGVTCGRCGENCSGEPGSKRRRLSCEDSEAESLVIVDDVEGNAVEHSPKVLVEDAHMSFNVEQTFDVITTSDSCAAVVEATSETVTAGEASFDVEVETSGSFVVEDSPDSVTEESSDSVVEVDVVGDDDTVNEDPCQRQFPSFMDASCTQQSDSGFCGDEASSEEGDDDAFSDVCQRPPRISPFLNTPKQRKEERRKILKLSIHKMRAVEDPEHFLRRSVLINNTMKRLQRELREEKMRNSPRRGCYGLYRRSSACHYDVLNNSYLLHDEPFAVSENDRITDDMTDALVTRLEATSSQVVPTPSPSPCPVVEADTSFPTSSSEESSLSCSSDVSSSLMEPTSTSSADLTSSLSEPCSSVSENLVHTGSEFMAAESDALPTSGSSLTQPTSSSSSSASSPRSTVYDDSASFPANSLMREAQSPSSSCSSESQKEKQLYADIDVVFNNLIHALGDS